jgi:hypothetical protein
MLTAEESEAMRAKLIEHLESSLAMADELREGTAGYFIESALDQIRSGMWPANLDIPRP